MSGLRIQNAYPHCICATLLDHNFKIWWSEIYQQRLLSVLESNALKLLGNESVFNDGETSLSNSQSEDHASYESVLFDGCERGPKPLPTSRVNA